MQHENWQSACAPPRRVFFLPKVRFVRSTLLVSSPPAKLDQMSLDRDGAERFDSAATRLLGQLEDLFEHHPASAAGTRLFDNQDVRALLVKDSPIARLAADLLGPRARPVRAILFDKRKSANWRLGWHQDRVVAVRQRADVPGFGPWSVKRGVPHVAPPWSILGAMRTLRVHLDAVSADNAPLLVAPGSHCIGIVAEPEIEAVVARLGTRSCLAAAGDVWAYATPILHASAPSLEGLSRRVLQLDFAAVDLPDGLSWYGV